MDRETLHNQLAQVDAVLLNQVGPSNVIEGDFSKPQEQADSDELKKIQAGIQADHVRKNLSLAVKLIGPMFPTVAAVYSDDTIDDVSQACGDLAAKYGWNLEMTVYQEEIAFAFVVLPVGYQSYKAAMMDLDNISDQEADRPGGSDQEQKPAVVQDHGPAVTAVQE